MRRKALQEEIDRESGKTEASEPRKGTVSLALELLEAVRSAPWTSRPLPGSISGRGMATKLAPAPEAAPATRCFPPPRNLSCARVLPNHGLCDCSHNLGELGLLRLPGRGILA